MRLIDLEPEFVRYEESTEGYPGVKPVGGDWGSPYAHTAMIPVATLEEAQGILFLCPLCASKHPDLEGVHQVEVTFADRGVLDNQGSHNIAGIPSRWRVSGTDASDLTTLPSIHLAGPGCGWHGYITDGEAA